MADQLIISCQKGYDDLIASLKGLSKPLLVCGNSAKKLKAFSIIQKAFENAVIFSDFSPNPAYESALSGTKMFFDKHCDSIIAVGGGSAMDVAKCIKYFAAQNNAYLSQAPISFSIPFFALPTTAGTGSEATHFAVIYINGEKTSIAHSSLVPDLCIIDPTVLETLPQYQRKATAMDAVCHAVEAFWSVNATDESRSYSKEALWDVENSVKGYLSNSESGNLNMLLKANLAGKAINTAKTTAAHAMSYKLTSLYKISHGHAAALCLKEVWAELLKEKEKLSPILDDLAKAFGKEKAEDGYSAFCRLLELMDFEVPTASQEELELLSKSVNLQRLKNTPISFNFDTIYNMYKRMLQQNGR